jgi:hypothetical protein
MEKKAYRNGIICLVPSSLYIYPIMSTLLNHVVPPFYACYLLNSRATPNSNRTYVSKNQAFLNGIGWVNAQPTQTYSSTQRRNHTRRKEHESLQTMGKSLISPANERQCSLSSMGTTRHALADVDSRVNLLRYRQVHTVPSTSH